MRPDSDMVDVQVWALILVVQGISYTASVAVAIISGLPRLPASLVGPMEQLAHRPATR
jgi:hypothetical protein